MKKLLLILLAVSIVLPASGFAQMGFGILAGINLSNLTGDDVTMMGIDPSMKLGMAGGAFAKLPFSDAVAFRIEALYSQAGTKWSDSGVTVNMNLAYIQVPLLVQFCFQTSGSIMPMIFGGGYLALNLSAKVKGGGMDIDVKDDTKSLDYGITHHLKWIGRQNG